MAYDCGGLGMVSAPTIRLEACTSSNMPKKSSKLMKKVPKIIQKGDNLQQDMDLVSSYVVK